MLDLDLLTDLEGSTQKKHKEPDAFSLTPIASLAKWETGSKDEDAFLRDYIWNSYSGWFSLRNYYLQTKQYEQRFGFSSAEMYQRWKANTLPIQGNEINEWLIKYLQIKDQIT